LLAVLLIPSARSLGRWLADDVSES